MAEATVIASSQPRTVPKMSPGTTPRVPALSTTPPQGPTRLRVVAMNRGAGVNSAARWAGRAARNSATDIGRMVEAYRSVQKVAWPLVLCYESALTVLGWEYPILTVCVWLCLQLCCVFMTPGQLLFIGFLSLCTLASIGYLSVVNRQLSKESAAFNSQGKGNKTLKQQILSSLKSPQTVVTPTLSSRASLPSLQETGSEETKGHGNTKSATLRGVSSSSKISELASEGQRSKSQPATTFLSQSLPTTSSLSAISSASTKSMSGGAQAARNSPPSSTSTTSRAVEKNGSEMNVSPSLNVTAARNHRASLEITCQRRKELLGEYRQMISRLDLWLMQVSVWLKWLEDTLLWKCKCRTILFYLALFIGLTCITYLPFRWFPLASSNCLFIANPYSYSRLRGYIKSLMSSTGKVEEERCNDVTSSEQKGSSESRLQKDGPVSSHPLSEDVVSSEEADEQGLEGGGSGTPQPPPQRPSTAEGQAARGASTSQPKRFDSGMCYLCGALFTSVLKRRRYCRHCGRDFCPKCCFKKVPRSVLGATAPAAQTEKELVCQLCYIKVTGEEAVGVR